MCFVIVFGASLFVVRPWDFLNEKYESQDGSEKNSELCSGLVCGMQIGGKRKTLAG